MEKKQYYAITTSMLFEKTVLVPVGAVKNLDEAINIVDEGVAVSSIMVLTEDADFETKASCYADSDGIMELTDVEASIYQIVDNEED